jgi:hypothetical protein
MSSPRAYCISGDRAKGNDTHSTRGRAVRTVLGGGDASMLRWGQSAYSQWAYRRLKRREGAAMNIMDLGPASASLCTISVRLWFGEEQAY